MIQEAPEDERQALMALLDEQTRKEVTALLAYAEDDAGDQHEVRDDGSEGAPFDHQY